MRTDFRRRRINLGVDGVDLLLVLVGLPVDFHHGCVGLLACEAVLLDVTRLFTIAADHLGLGAGIFLFERFERLLPIAQTNCVYGGNFVVVQVICVFFARRSFFATDGGDGDGVDVSPLFSFSW